MKRLASLFTLVLILSSVATQLAEADWYDKGVPLTNGQNPVIALTGTFAFTSPNGGVHCNAGVMELELIGGTTDGHISTINAEEADKCEIVGPLALLCKGTTTIQSFNLTSTPTLINNGGANIRITNVDLDVECTGLTVTLISMAGQPMVATPDNTTGIGKLTLSGRLQAKFGEFPGESEVTMAGTQSVLGGKAGTYGLVS